MVSKIGNPRLSHLVKYGKFAASICAAKEIGSTGDRINITQNANDSLYSQLRAIDENSYMKEKEKKAAGLPFFKTHTELPSRKPEGTVDRLPKIDPSSFKERGSFLFL